MNYANIIPYDTANGEGIRTSIFVSGCTIHCPGCFNEEAQDFNYGQLYTRQTRQTILDHISKPYIAGLSILGGDPMCQDEDGLRQLLNLVSAVRTKGKTVWLWTGLTYDNIFNSNTISNRHDLQQCLFMACNVVVDGPFIKSEKDLTLAFRGSSNQRLINVQQTLIEGHVVLYSH